MDNLKSFIVVNPQVSASMITALFGILGIFINIFINLWFRKRDYEIKVRMQQMENLESYYLPLCDKVLYLQKCIQNISDEDKDLYKILNSETGARYASEIKILKDILSALFAFCNEEKCKFPDNYKLFRIHRETKSMIIDLNQFIGNNMKMKKQRMTKKTIEEIEELIYRIRQYETCLTINNCFVKWIQYIKNWLSYKNIRIFFSKK